MNDEQMRQDAAAIWSAIQQAKGQDAELGRKVTETLGIGDKVSLLGDEPTPAAATDPASPRSFTSKLGATKDELPAVLQAQREREQRKAEEQADDDEPSWELLQVQKATRRAEEDRERLEAQIKQLERRQR